MPLTRGEAVGYDADLMMFKFTMRNGEQIVQCQISRAALGDLADRWKGSARDLRAEFEAHRELIEAKASELFGRDRFDKLAMRLKLSRRVPPRAPPTTSQITKRGIADLALHNLLAIPHREFEHHQIGIIPKGLTSRQRHEPGSFPMAR